MSVLYTEHYLQQLQMLVVDSLEQWSLSSNSSVELLTVSENATFKVTDNASAQQHVVRIHRPDYHTVREIHSELQWITDLKAHDTVITPKPVKTVDAELVLSVTSGNITNYLVAFEFMPGNEPSVHEPLTTHFQQLGGIAARLHQHAARWTRPASFSRRTWNFDTTIGATPHWGSWRRCSGLSADQIQVLSRTVDVIETQLEHYGTSADRFGLIHADLRLANLLVDKNKLTVIDFDDCGFGWYTYDFAAAISFMEEDEQVPQLLAAWLRGYREIAHLHPEDEAVIPTFIMLRRLMLTAWLATHSETPTARQSGDNFMDGTVRMATRMLRSGSPLDIH